MKLRRYVLTAALVLVASTAAFAHAHLRKAEPPVGSTVRASPAEVRLWFSEKLEPSFSRLQVLDARGESVAGANSTVDPTDPAQISVPLKALTPGTYKVVWRAVSVDTHVTEGDHTFTVSQQSSMR